MAVSYDTSTESHTGTTGSTSEASFTWNHTAGANAEGVSVLVVTNGSATDKISSVTYGGTSMTRVSGGAAISSDGDEPGRADLFHLGSSVPSGTQAVVVNRTNDATIMYAVAISVQAAANTEVYAAGIQKDQTVGTLAEVNVDDGSPGADSVRFASGHFGLDATPSAGANSTSIQLIDFGTQVSRTVYETTAGQGSRPVGFSSASSQDRAIVYWAVREASGATLTDVDTDETIYTGQSGIAYTGTGLTNADGLVITADGVSVSAASFSATNATSGTFTAPTLAACFTAGVKFGSSTFDIQDGGVSLATLAGTFNAESTYTVHTVSDISQATNPGTVYYWINNAGTDVAVGDQIIFDNKSGAVTMDSQGFFAFASGETETTYRARDDTDNTWSSDWATFSVLAATTQGIGAIAGPLSVTLVSDLVH